MAITIQDTYEFLKLVETEKNFVIKSFKEIDDFEILILKAHLIIEHTLDDFINSFAIANIDISNMDFSFTHKIKVAKILGLTIYKSTFENQLILLNKLRNSIAHNLKYD
jgi:hypothetical protein